MSTSTQKPKIQTIPQKPKVESIPQKPKVESIPQKPESQSAKETSDIYSVCQQSIDKYFKEAKSNAAIYLQSVSDLQLEIVESRKNIVESAISLQKTMADKLGTNTKLPDESLDIITNFAEQTTKAWNLQNQLTRTSLETLTKNIQAFNDSSQTFTELNSKLIDFWASIIKQKNQE